MAVKMRGRRGAWLLGAALILGAPAQAAAKPKTPPPAASATDPAAKDAPADEGKPITLDLTKGPFIKQMEDGGHLPKQAFTPSSDGLKPYAGASLGPSVAYTLAHDNEKLIDAPELERECDAIIKTLLDHWKGPRPEAKVLITASTNYGARANEAGVILGCSDNLITSAIA